MVRGDELVISLASHCFAEMDSAFLCASGSTAGLVASCLSTSEALIGLLDDRNNERSSLPHFQASYCRPGTWHLVPMSRGRWAVMAVHSVEVSAMPLHDLLVILHILVSNQAPVDESSSIKHTLPAYPQDHC